MISLLTPEEELALSASSARAAQGGTAETGLRKLAANLIARAEAADVPLEVLLQAMAETSNDRVTRWFLKFQALKVEYLSIYGAFLSDCIAYWALFAQAKSAAASLWDRFTKGIQALSPTSLIKSAAPPWMKDMYHAIVAWGNRLLHDDKEDARVRAAASNGMLMFQLALSSELPIIGMLAGVGALGGSTPVPGTPPAPAPAPPSPVLGGTIGSGTTIPPVQAPLTSSLGGGVPSGQETASLGTSLESIFSGIAGIFSDQEGDTVVRDGRSSVR